MRGRGWGGPNQPSRTPPSMVQILVCAPRTSRAKGSKTNSPSPRHPMMEHDSPETKNVRPSVKKHRALIVLENRFELPQKEAPFHQFEIFRGGVTTVLRKNHGLFFGRGHLKPVLLHWYLLINTFTIDSHASIKATEKEEPRCRRTLKVGRFKGWKSARQEIAAERAFTDCKVGC